MSGKELKAKLYQFGFEAAEWPSDENIRTLRRMISEVLAISQSPDVNSKARLALSALDQIGKLRTLERRKMKMERVADYVSRIVHYQ